MATQHPDTIGAARLQEQTDLGLRLAESIGCGAVLVVVEPVVIVGGRYIVWVVNAYPR